MSTLPWVLPPLRPGFPADPALAARRRAIDELQADQSPVAGTSVREQVVGGVACTVAEPDHASERTFLYLHGGGYRLGAAAHWTAFASRLALAAAARVVVADYRLAPEHPFPAALHDAAAVHEALLDDGPVILAGDSAGGGLAAALVVACARSRVALPVGVVLISPWVDLSVTAASYASRAATDVLFSAASAREAAASYLAGHDPADPLASPVAADVDGFPPTLVLAGGAEVLLDDALTFTTRLVNAGSSVELHVVAGMQHVWPTIAPDLEESVAALGAIAGFARRVSR